MARSSCVLALVCAAMFAGCIVPDGLPLTLSSSARARVYEAVYVHQRAIQLYEQGRVNAAIAVAEKARDLLRDALGDTHICVAIPIHTLAVFHHTQGDYALAEPLYAEVLAILGKRLGAGDINLALPMDELAGLYMQWGAYGKAEPLYARALALRQRELRPSHPDVIQSFNNLALALEKQGAYSRAEPLYAHALALAEHELGPRHRDVARGLNGLGMLYWRQGAYARAEPLLVRSLNIREGLLSQVIRFGPANIEKLTDVFQSMPRSLRNSSWSVGVTVRNTRSTRALAGYRDAVISWTSDAWLSLSNIEQLYSVSSPYTGAEPLVAGTADVFETVLGTVRADVAQSRESLAQLFVTTGELRRAEPLLLQTLDAHEKRLGKSHPDLANGLNNLAQLYQAQGEYAKAEALLLRVLRIREQAPGNVHADVARSLNNLTLLYRAQGAYDKAEPLLIRTVALLEQTLGKRHPDVARSLNNLAALYHDRGAYAKAEELYLRAIDIASKGPAGKHPDAARYLNNLAVLYYASGVPEKAEPLLARAVELREAQLRSELPQLSASRKRALMGLLQRETESLVSLHADSSPASAQVFELALTTVLRRKGLALESLIDNYATLRAQSTPAIHDKLDQLAKANAELSALLRAPFDPRRAAAQALEAASRRARIELLESELNAASAALRAQSQPITPAMIQAALPDGAALIELVRYRRFDPRQDRQRWQEARYVAYVLQRQGPPQWVALGEAAPIDAGVDAVLASMHRSSGADAARAALQHLDALVLAPLRSRLVGISHLIVSPDNKLNLVPFEALLDPQGHYELEHRLVSYTTSGRDVLQLATRRAPRSPATIVAAPEYGPGRAFVRLDDARAEAIEVSAHFSGARLLTGNGATRAALAAIVGPSVLHVATHGFFARDAAARPRTAPATPPPGPPDALERDMFIEGDATTSSTRASDDDPSEALDRAGLALANANVRPDGVVTAREIASYDWWGTRLVVLSACATGVGAMPSGEGVYGLRRALALAGAESQVVSLWNVSDSSARALMRELYDELARGVGRAEALRRAKLRLLQQPRFAHPYYWAAFIPAGNWAPLDRTAMLQPRRAPR